MILFYLRNGKRERVREIPASIDQQIDSTNVQNLRARHGSKPGAGNSTQVCHVGDRSLISYLNHHPFLARVCISRNLESGEAFLHPIQLLEYEMLAS